MLESSVFVPLFSCCKQFFELRKVAKVRRFEDALKMWSNALGEKRRWFQFCEQSGKDVSKLSRQELEALVKTEESETELVNCPYTCLLHNVVEKECDFDYVFTVLRQNPIMAYIRNDSGLLPYDIAAKQKNRFLMFLLQPRVAKQLRKFLVVRVSSHFLLALGSKM